MRKAKWSCWQKSLKIQIKFIDVEATQNDAAEKVILASLKCHKAVFILDLLLRERFQKTRFIIALSQMVRCEAKGSAHRCLGTLPTWGGLSLFLSAPWFQQFGDSAWYTTRGYILLWGGKNPAEKYIQWHRDMERTLCETSFLKEQTVSLLKVTNPILIYRNRGFHLEIWFSAAR